MSGGWSTQTESTVRSTVNEGDRLNGPPLFGSRITVGETRFDYPDIEDALRHLIVGSEGPDAQHYA